MRTLCIMIFSILLSASALFAVPDAVDSTEETAKPSAQTTTAAPAPAPKPLMVIKETAKAPAAPATSEANTPVFSTPAAKSEAKPANNALSWQIFKTVLNLALVLAIAYLVVLGAQKYYQGRLPNLPTALLGGNKPRRVMRIVESAPLGPARQVHLLSVGNRTFLLASAGQQLTLLTEVTGDAEVDEAVRNLQQPQPSPFQAGQPQGATTEAGGREHVNPQAAELIDQFARVLASKMAPSGERS